MSEGTAAAGTAISVVLPLVIIGVAIYIVVVHSFIMVRLDSRTPAHRASAFECSDTSQPNRPLACPLPPSSLLGVPLQVKEREAVIIERFGRFSTMLQPGINFIVPFMDSPKKYNWRYWVTDNTGNPNLVVRNTYRISNQNEGALRRRCVRHARPPARPAHLGGIRAGARLPAHLRSCPPPTPPSSSCWPPPVIDFPKQMVISRDNARLQLDAVLSWKIVNQRQMIYSSANLPQMLSHLLQAQLRNVAGSLDVDQIIEEAATLNVLTSMLDNDAMRWGVKILFVKVQRIDALTLSGVLAQRKNADLKNREIVIQARATKQTLIIESEGKRDAMTKEAEGAAQEMISKARGQATAITNAANAEARSIKEVGRALAADGENPALYLIAVRYLEVLKQALQTRNTTLELLPPALAQLKAAEMLGLNTAAIGRA